MNGLNDLNGGGPNDPKPNPNDPKPDPNKPPPPR
jgi:hypothetical protein